MGNDVMWLRDLLPTEPAFSKARIMTIGYNSKLFHKAELARLEHLAAHVLRVASMSRSSAKVGTISLETTQVKADVQLGKTYRFYLPFPRRTCCS